MSDIIVRSGYQLFILSALGDKNTSSTIKQSVTLHEQLVFDQWHLLQYCIGSHKERPKTA